MRKTMRKRVFGALWPASALVCVVALIAAWAACAVEFVMYWVGAEAAGPLSTCIHAAPIVAALATGLTLVFERLSR